MQQLGQFSRRRFLKASVAASVAAPLVIPGSALGADGATPANDRIVIAGIGMGGQGRGNLGGFLGFPEVQVVAVCDVVGSHCRMAKEQVDQRYGNKDCQCHGDYQEITNRPDIDAVLIGTPDHWHAIISIDAMRGGKDVYCEKPECLTITEGRRMTTIARRYGRVFSGGSQRVWGDYEWFHKMVRGGAIGDVKEAWVNVGGPSGPCYLPPVDTPPDVDWDRWLGPAPWRPFHPTLIAGGFRPFRDYSGGGMTDWGCHTFGGALFTLNLHHTGPVEVIPPDGQEFPRLTYIFENGVRIYHGGGWDGILNFRGTEGEISERGDRNQQKRSPPDIYIPNYKGRGGIFGDFLHCVRSRELPFRDVEVAHRTAVVAHLGNIAYWLNRRLRWDAVKEEIVGDPEANRWLDRTRRAPWSMA
ncbi:MAG: Gfo/Idh/MocA family oxidoreductase [Planctomycetes bacterium]|nr:Gfo/Idh/MocA family oxidoreductase [Planctomycetota bacterium]